MLPTRKSSQHKTARAATDSCVKSGLPRLIYVGHVRASLETAKSMLRPWGLSLSREYHLFGKIYLLPSLDSRISTHVPHIVLLEEGLINKLNTDPAMTSGSEERAYVEVVAEHLQPQVYGGSGDWGDSLTPLSVILVL